MAHLPPAIETARALLDASEALSPDKYLRHVTQDVVIHSPGFIMGPLEIVGHDEVRAAFERLKETLGPKRKFFVGRRRYFLDHEDESKVLVTVQLTISDPYSHSFGTEVAMLNTMAGDKVSRVDSWTTPEEGLAQLKDPVEIDA